MKKNTFLGLLLLGMSTTAWAQQSLKVNQNSGKLVLQNISNVSVEGYEGNEIIISSPAKKTVAKDPRAAGLSSLGNAGFDNTGMGLSLNQSNHITVLSLTEPDEKNRINIKLPYKVALTIRADRYSYDQDSSQNVLLKNLQSEVDVNLRFNNIKFSNLKGPLSVKTINGNIEGTLSSALKGPISLVTIEGFIDLGIHEQSKLDLAVSNIEGKLYADKSLKFEMKASNADLGDGETSFHPKIVFGSGSVRINGKIITDSLTVPPSPPSISTITISGFAMGSRFNGTLNGGGEKISIKSTTGNIYIRKQ
jgi:hypothetical protein